LGIFGVTIIQRNPTGENTHPTKLSIQLQIREAANITDRNKVLAGKLDTNGSKRGHKFSDFAVKVKMIN
jgi:hypothetical protein